MIFLKFKVFTKKTCYKCVPVKDKLQKSEYGQYIEYIDCDSEEGLEQAVKYGVASLPTIISVDENDNELSRYETAEEVFKRIETALGK